MKLTIRQREILLTVLLGEFKATDDKPHYGEAEDYLSELTEIKNILVGDDKYSFVIQLTPKEEARDFSGEIPF